MLRLWFWGKMVSELERGALNRPARQSARKLKKLLF